ncbi:hypothetical protein [Marinobacter sp.]|uniref:hypothetical protein n=1 Tax=Marinobacter sp. TaxID=50741 RepID=UPI00384CF2DD
MKQWKIFFSSLIAAGLLASAANASIVYVVDQPGGTGSVKGTITTDGTLGVLTQSSIIDLSLTLTDKVGSYLLEWDNAIFWEYAISSETEVIGLTATRRNLLSDPQTPGGVMHLAQIEIWDEGPYWRGGEVYAGPTIFNCECSYDEYFELYESRVASTAGFNVIGISTSIVSEPGSMVLMSLALGALAGTRAMRR